MVLYKTLEGGPRPSRSCRWLCLCAAGDAGRDHATGIQCVSSSEGQQPVRVPGAEPSSSSATPFRQGLLGIRLSLGGLAAWHNPSRTCSGTCRPCKHCLLGVPNCTGSDHVGCRRCALQVRRCRIFPFPNSRMRGEKEFWIPRSEAGIVYSKQARHFSQLPVQHRELASRQ